MRVKRYLPVILVIAAFVGKTSATEFRSPLSVERGPMRYVFEEWEEKDYGLKMWTSGYMKESHKAFLSHGTDTKPLSALFFNKSDFNLSEVFPNCYPDPSAAYYSPYLAVTKLSPRISYEEKGVSIGARFAYPVYKNKGRIGLRAQIPFRKIEIEREDPGDKDTNQLDDLLTKEVVTRTAADGTFSKDVLARGIRLDFLQSLIFTTNNDPLLSINTSGRVKAGNNAAAEWNSVSDVNATNRVLALVHSPEGLVPHEPDRYLGIHELPAASGSTPNVTPTPLPNNGVVSDNKQYQFNTANNYTALNMHAVAGTVAQKLQALEASSKLWVTSVHKSVEGIGGVNGQESLSQGSKTLWSTIDSLVETYNSNVYEWLADRGYVFESNMRKGLGDIDLDLFYEHQFSDDLNAEIMVGVRFPTGINANYCGNPYKAHLGNGEHFEVKVGGMFAWQPLDWMNIKLDARYSFVLEATEKRAAVFKGANIKNIGPCVDADVDWGYFVGQLDFNLFHPKTDAISSVIGYELYYKTTDNINFKCKTMESWLGKKHQLKSGSTTEYEWVENKQELSSRVAEKNSEAFAHKVRMETSFRISKWFELYFGGSYVFAGQNVPCECDGHCGYVITF